jgi:hypothetical protein
MTEQFKARINGYGEMFRFITPILIIIVGYFITTGISDVKVKLRDMNVLFVNHAAHHQTIEVQYEGRITHLETRHKIGRESYGVRRRDDLGRDSTD